MEGLDTKPFHFKNFSIYHHPAVMKVSTDSVLLGCWADVEKDKVILDAGCGSGLISMMAAQRNSLAKIIGIDIQPFAIELSRYNQSNTAFDNEIRFLEANLFDWNPAITFDHILCNPPYFEDISKSRNNDRNLFRHARKDFLKCLLIKVADLLKKDGKLSLVLPKNRMDHFMRLVEQSPLYINRTLSIYHNAKKPISLQLFEVWNVKQEVNEVDHGKLILYDHAGKRTNEYTRLCKDFYK